MISNVCKHNETSDRGLHGFQSDITWLASEFEILVKQNEALARVIIHHVTSIALYSISIIIQVFGWFPGKTGVSVTDFWKGCQSLAKFESVTTVVLSGCSREW